ncbi:unnamed protein product [Cladocopium goreaui]|uniref:Uncharacterized protein n=1 Tax=Cladocopium goreaui TaxID=2562237 RepID=A0A9P1C026_9DINO|nr:unnamed protein product [Cladocopium goreaui]
MGNSTPFHQSSTSTNVRPAQAGKMPSAQSVQWCAMVAVGFLASEALQRWRRQQSLAAVRREQIDFEEMLSQEAGPSEGAQSSAEAKPTSDEASKPEEKLFGLRTLLEALQADSSMGKDDTRRK